MKLFFSLLLVLFSIGWSYGQIIIGIGSRWDNSLSEWIIHTEYEGEEGILQQRWANDFTHWEYQVGDQRGEIRLKWTNDPTQWEIRGDGEIIDAKIIWSNDFREWRITDNTHTIEVKVKWGNDLNQWYVDSADYGSMEINTLWENDVRDWEVLDELGEEISFPMRMAVVFIVVFNSMPNY